MSERESGNENENESGEVNDGRWRVDDAANIRTQRDRERPRQNGSSLASGKQQEATKQKKSTRKSWRRMQTLGLEKATRIM